MFDKQYRYYKRKYESEKQTMIEQFRTTDPKQFWKALKNIGPKRSGPCHSIPWKVISSDGEITSNKNDVSNVWKNKFQLLYSAPVIPVNSVFINHNVDSLAVFDLMYSDDVIMDSPILIEEVERAIKSKKLNKSVSIDGLPYEVYKNTFSAQYIVCLFNMFFMSSFIPDVWRTDIIKPILKKSTIERMNPLEYRGISLIPNL